MERNLAIRFVFRQVCPVEAAENDSQVLALRGLQAGAGHLRDGSF
jgi:hypothetical protein